MIKKVRSRLQPKKSATAFAAISLICASFSFSPNVLVNEAVASSTGPSGLPLPRFVSLKAKRVNMRVGPGREYKVEWMYTRRGLPLEIIQEYGNWRKVRDSEGSEGWILQSLLSGKRTAMVTPWEEKTIANFIPLKAAPNKQAAVLANMEPGVVTNIKECENGWCRVVIKEYKGYAEQSVLWGVYPDEILD